MSLRCLFRASRRLLVLLPALWLAAGALSALAQDIPPDLLDEAVRRTGLSREELLRRYREGTLPENAGLPAAGTAEPGRASLEGIDDTVPPTPSVTLPTAGGTEEVPATADSVIEAAAAEKRLAAVEEREGYFGADFFRLEPGVFNPTTFGPVPEDYLIGVGDEIVVDVWGEVEFRITRVVDRDGTIILPKGGKITCYNKTLSEVSRAVRQSLARSYSGISMEPGKGTTFVDVQLGQLRAIRVFVVGDAVQPGAYELSSVSTVFTALYAAGGPSAAGSMRDVRLVRGGEAVAALDIYEYLLEGRREGDRILREGDTVFIPPRGKTVTLHGEVRRPLKFELLPDEGMTDLLRFGGGFTATAAVAVVHVERILPPAARAPESPDRVFLDVALDPETGAPVDAAQDALMDGDVVTVGAIADRLESWVEVQGNVKRPGRYQHRAGMTAAELIASAGGLWPDTLEERALIDRTTPELEHLTLSFPLGDVLAGRAAPVPLEAQDVLHVFSRWDVRERYEVTISGEVKKPGAYEFREGMTLRDLILKAGGLKDGADLLKAEVSRLRLSAVGSRDTSEPPMETVDVLDVSLGADFLTAAESFPLAAHDKVAVRRLPWWELQRTVTLRGEVYFPGIYTLERPNERLSEVIARAGGLKPTAYAPGARVQRAKDDVGMIAIDLGKALGRPACEQDIILAAGDVVEIPDEPYTVKVMGAVGYPTSIVFEKGRSLGEYVDRAGGYAENADKWKTHVVYPNGLSRPIKRIWRDPGVQPGSTIVVPVKPPPTGESSLSTLKEIAAIFASVATVYLVIDRTTN